VAKNKAIVLTKNKEIYNKLSSLIFSNEVLIDNSKIKSFQLDRIIKNVNNRSKEGKVLERESLDKYTIIRKLGHLNFSVYFKA